MSKIKFRKGFTLPEVMLIVAVAGILMITSSLKFIQLRDNIRIDRVKAQMKVLQIGFRMYYADVGLFPIRAKGGDGIGYDGLADWRDYLMTGDRIGASANDEDENPFDQRIDNWFGKYIDEATILTDPWGNSFVYLNYSYTDSYKSGILSWGPAGFTGAGAGTDWGNYLRSDGTPFKWTADTKEKDPPDDEGFSVFLRDGDPDNEKTDFIMVLWME